MSGPLRPLVASASRALSRAALSPRTYAAARSTTFVRLKHSKRQPAPVGSKKQRPGAHEVDLSTYETERREGETFDVGALQRALVEAIDRFRVELKPLIGRISELSPAMLDRVRVKTESKDPPTVPLNTIASIETVRGGLEIRPFDSSTQPSIEAALQREGLNPSVVNQSTIRIAAPKPDMALRKRLVHEAAGAGDKARNAISNARRKAQKQIEHDKKSKVINSNEASAELEDVEAATRLRSEEVDRIKAEAEAVLLDK